MNSFFAAGLFDSPWMVAVIVIGGALINWLSTRRQKKLASQEAAGEVEPAATSEGQPAGEFNLEAALRRLLGEEPAAESAPPPIPRAAPGELPPIAIRRAAVPAAPVKKVVSPPRHRSIAAARLTPTSANEQKTESARRFEQLNEQGRHPATVIGRRREPGSSWDNRATARWRNPRNVRQAFIASLIFAPPKGLET